MIDIYFALVNLIAGGVMYRPIPGKKWFVLNAYAHSQIFMSFCNFRIILETCTNAFYKIMTPVFNFNFANANNFASIFSDES